MKVYLKDDKTHVDPRPHNDISWGLKVALKLQTFLIAPYDINVQCNLDLVTLLVSSESHNVTKLNDFIKRIEKWSLWSSH